MSARLLPPPGGDGVCPVLAGGGGEREVYGGIPDCCCTMRFVIAELGRYPAADGVGVGTGTGPELTGVVAGLVARPPWRIACLLFWNLKEQSMGSEIITKVSTKGMGQPNLHTPRRHVQLLRQGCTLFCGWECSTIIRGIKYF